MGDFFDSGDGDGKNLGAAGIERGGMPGAPEEASASFGSQIAPVTPEFGAFAFDRKSPVGVSREPLVGHPSLRRGGWRLKQGKSSYS